MTGVDSLIGSTLITNTVQHRIDEGSYGTYHPPTGFLILNGSGNAPTSEPAQPETFALRERISTKAISGTRLNRKMPTLSAAMAA